MKFREIYQAMPPDIRSQTNARQVLKAIDDVRRLKEQARYVLILDAQGKLINIIYRATYFANLIAVLAPATLHGIPLPEALVLEIGISRTRPYQAVERVTREGTKKLFTKRLMKRTRVRPMSTYELAKLWPDLERLFASATRAARLRWKNKEAWWVTSRKGTWQFERGIYFSVDNRDSRVRLFVLNEEMRRRHAFLREYAGRLADHMHRYRKQYSEERLKRLIGIREAIAMWKSSGLPRSDQGVVLAALPRRTRSLFERSLSAFGLSRPDLERVRKPRKEQPFLAYGQIRLVRREGSVHGKQCVTFEFSFTRRVREELNL